MEQKGEKGKESSSITITKRSMRQEEVVEEVEEEGG